jgi:ABC-type multidrug transport system fused ATPase/permease subunit
VHSTSTSRILDCSQRSRALLPPDSNWKLARILLQGYQHYRQRACGQHVTVVDHVLDPDSRVVTYSVPIFLAFVFPLAFMYVCTVRVFIRTSIPLMRASGTSVSQVVLHTVETLSGIALLSAFRQQEKFLEDNHKVATYYSIANLQLWLAFRVDIIGAKLVLACCMLAVLNDGLSASGTGLIVRLLPDPAVLQYHVSLLG